MSESQDTPSTPTPTLTAYDSIEIDIQWYPEDDIDTNVSPSSEHIALLFLNLQLFYDEICDGIGYPRHYLQVDRMTHPNMSINLKGLGEPIKALQAFLESLPKLIVSIVTMRKRIEQENITIETNIQYLSVLKKAMVYYNNAPIEFKKEHLREFLRYSMAQEKITPPLPLSIKSSRKPSSQAQTKASQGQTSTATPSLSGNALREELGRMTGREQGQ